MAQAGPGIGRRGLLTGIGAGLAAPALLSGTAEAAVPLASLYEAAKREGKLVYWSPEEVPLVRALIKRFNATYPGIAVTHFRIEPAPALQRMVAEKQAGQVNVDAFNSPLLYMETVLSHDLAAKVNWSQYDVEKDYIFYDGQAVSCWDLEMPLCINTDMVKPGEITSWDDLAKPKWRHKVLLEARGLPLAILWSVWGKEKTLDYIKRIKANDPVILVGGSPAAEALMSGRVAAVIGTYSSKIDLKQKMGAPVAWLTVSPIPVIVYVMSAANGCKNPNAARLWAAWIASEDGQKAVYETTNFGLVHGSHISPNGKKMRAAGAKIVLEDPDPKVSHMRLTEVAQAIGALK